MNPLRNFVLLIFLFNLSQSLHQKFVPRPDIYQMITDAVQLYRNDEQLDAQILKSAQNHPHYFNLIACQNDPHYKYVIISKPTEPNSSQEIPKKEVIISCNIHARQLITAQVCVDFVSNISNALSSQNNNQNQTDLFSFKSIDEILSKAKITVFYRGNQMRDTVLSNSSHYCIRKDQNQVDINRNFPTDFTPTNQSSSQVYPGKSPLTEPFSQCIDSFFQSINLTQRINTYIDIHTGEFSLYDSFQSEDNKTRPLLQKIKKSYCPQCKLKSLGIETVDGEENDGQIFTDVKKRYQGKHSILLQIYGGYNEKLRTFQRCIAEFNPLTKRQLDYFREIWRNALVDFIKMTL